MQNKTQAIIFDHNSSTTSPAKNKLGFELEKNKTILGVTLTCDLHGMDENINKIYEAIEKMLEHWSHRI